MPSTSVPARRRPSPWLSALRRLWLNWRRMRRSVTQAMG